MSVPEGLRIWELHRAELLKLRVHRACPCCSQDQFAPEFVSQDGYDYGTCKNCGVLYCPDIIPLSTWDHVYETNSDYAVYMRDYTVAPLSRKAAPDAASVERFSGYFRQLEAFRRLKGSRLLDIGTYDGDALIVAADQFSMNAFGIEGRRQIAEIAATKRGLAVAAGTSDNLDPNIFDGQFDVITAFESFEHTADPVKSLQRFRAALKPDGLLMMTMPNADNFELALLRELSPHVQGGQIGTGHINFFGVKTLRYILLRAGFQPLIIFSQFGSSLVNITAKLLAQPSAISNYQNELDGGASALALDVGELNLLGLLGTAFNAWETRELKGPILGVIAR